MDAIQLLKQQHEEVRKLFVELEHTQDEDDKWTIFEELADNLAAHATIEESIFYPAAYAKSTKDLLAEAEEEHLAVKRIIADLLELMPDDEDFDAKVKLLKEEVEHHVEEEESELLEKAKKELSTEERAELGARMEQLFEQSMDDDPSGKIPRQIAAAPLH